MPNNNFVLHNHVPIHMQKIFWIETLRKKRAFTCHALYLFEEIAPRVAGGLTDSDNRVSIQLALNFPTGTQLGKNYLCAWITLLVFLWIKGDPDIKASMKPKFYERTIPWANITLIASQETLLMKSFENICFASNLKKHFSLYYTLHSYSASKELCSFCTSKCIPPHTLTVHHNNSLPHAHMVHQNVFPPIL